MLRGWATLTMVLHTACAVPEARLCEADDECLLDGQAGECVAQACAYSDPQCESGRRFGPFASSGRELACTNEFECGNGALDPGEECDDDNDRDGDGCNADCTVSGRELDAFAWNDRGSDVDVAAMRVDGRTLCIAGQITEGGVPTPFVVVFDDRAVAWESRDWPASQGGRAHGCAVEAGTLVLVAGEERNPSTQGSRGWIRAYDGSGTELWRDAFESGSDDAVRGVALVDDVAIASVSTEAFVEVIGYDLGGERRWRHAIDGPRQVTALGSEGSSVVIAGISTGPDPVTAWLDELSATGIRGASVPPDEGPAVTDVLGASRGLAGDFAVVGRRGGRGWIARFEGDGAPSWEVEPSVGELRGVALDPEGDMVAVGSRLDDAWVGRFDRSGTQLWERTLDIGDIDRADAVAIDDDGTLLVVGTTIADGGGDLWVRRLSP